MGSPNLQKPPPTIRSSAPSIITSLSPSGTIAFSDSSNTMAEQISTSVTAPIARPTSVPSSMDGDHSFAPRTLFPEKTPALFPCEPVQPSVSSNSNPDDLPLSLIRLKVVSRLNPRAPDFRVPVKQPAVSIPTNQLPPTHQPPPIFNQQSMTPNYISSQHPPAMMPNAASMMSFQINKFNQQTSQAADNSQPQWSLMNAVAQHSNYSQNDLMSFVTPTTLNNLIHAQNNDMLPGLENGTLTNSPMNISPNSNAAASLMVAGLRGEERKIPPKPIGTERAWRTERERSMSLEQDPGNWMLDQKQSWNQQMFRNNVPSTVTTVQTASVPTSAPYSCLTQVPEDIRAPVLDGVYQVLKYFVFFFLM